MDEFFRLKLRFLTSTSRHFVPLPYARKTESGYAPVEGSISALVLERHLDGTQPIGGYLVRGNTTGLGAFDLDDHDGTAGWPLVTSIASRLVNSCEKRGLAPIVFRSGGGNGVHIFTLFDPPAIAADVRYVLREVLAEAGLTDGTGGLTAGQVEVYPKQDTVTPPGRGNLLALPLARRSELLDVHSLEPLALTDAEVTRLCMRISPAPPSKPHIEKGSHKGNGGQDADEEEVRAALKHVSPDPYDLWLRCGLALKHGFGDHGFVLWRDWSSSSPKFNGDEKLLKKWDGLKPNGDLTVGTLFYLAKQAGWNGPSDGWVREMNARFGILTHGSTTLIIPKNGDRRPEDDFLGLSKGTFVDRLAPERIQVKDAGGKPSSVSKAKAWLGHAKACHYHRLDFDPSLPPGHNGITWNTWTGFGVDPCPGDWSILRQHIFDNIAQGDAQIAEWVLNWLALGVQKPAEPLGTSLVLIGSPGTGKGVLANAYGRLWGSHYIPVTHSEQVTGRFSGHLMARRFVFIDEGTFGGNRRDAGMLKTRITEPILTFERKGIDAVRVRNRLMFMVASNELSVVPADVNDRRWMVVQVGDGRREDHAFFADLHAQLDGGGYSAMLHDLLHRDIGKGPDPRRIIRTKGLGEQIILAQPANVQYVHALLDAGRLPQNDVAGAASTTIEALFRDMRSRYPASAYISNATLGSSLNKMIPSVRTVQSGKYRAGYEDSMPIFQRSTRYDFPPLAKARAEFEAFVHAPIKWGEVAGWQLDTDCEEI